MSVVRHHEKDAADTSSCLVMQQEGILAHRGFMARARGIPVEALYAHAIRQGRRLVLCGESPCMCQSLRPNGASKHSLGQTDCLALGLFAVLRTDTMSTADMKWKPTVKSF